MESEVGAEVVTWTDIDEALCSCGGSLDITGAVEDEGLEV